MNIAVFNTDQRMRYLIELLKKDRHQITIIASSAQFEPVKEMKFDAVVLPMQGVNASGEIRIAKEQIFVMDFLQLQEKNCTLYTGMDNELFKQCGASVICLLKDASVNEKNAVLTAEGVLDSIIRNSEKGLRETKVDVIGYGVCGKALVEMLVKLDCPVRIVSTRKLNGEFIEGKYIETLYYPEYKLNADIIVNTAPACMITCALAKKAKNRPLVIDIASDAVGVEKKVRSCTLLRYEYLPGIPGRLSPKSAALILYDAIKKGEIQ